MRTGGSRDDAIGVEPWAQVINLGQSDHFERAGTIIKPVEIVSLADTCSP